MAHKCKYAIIPYQITNEDIMEQAQWDELLNSVEGLALLDYLSEQALVDFENGNVEVV